MKTIWSKVLPQYQYEEGELRIGVPSWDKGNANGELSVKYAYRKNGRIPRTAPEVSESMAVEMMMFLLENGRVSGQDKARLKSAM